MEPSFWLDAWESGRIGFHQERVHPDLLAFEEAFLADGPHRILVPLCGKTWDLRWLADRGHEVVGVELSEGAVEAFHCEHERDFTVEERGGFKVYRSANLDIHVGDFFELEVPRFDRVWDRAALVALPPQMRVRYAARIRELAEGGQMLLNAFEYDQRVMSGPPHSVPEAEVRALYGEVEVLQQADVIDQVPHFKSRGHRRWLQSTYLKRGLSSGASAVR